MILMDARSLRIGLVLLIVTQLCSERFAQSCLGQSSAVSQAVTVISDDVIQMDQTWSGNVLVTKAVTVASGVTLTIQPGTVVRFSPGRPFFITQAALTIMGRLIAIGTADKPIRFTSDVLQPDRGDWGGFGFSGGSAGNIIDHAIIEFAHTPARAFQ
jgi:hypothetical protein